MQQDEQPSESDSALEILPQNVQKLFQMFRSICSLPGVERLAEQLIKKGETRLTYFDWYGDSTGTLGFDGCALRSTSSSVLWFTTSSQAKIRFDDNGTLPEMGALSEKEAVSVNAMLESVYATLQSIHGQLLAISESTDTTTSDAPNRIADALGGE